MAGSWRTSSKQKTELCLEFTVTMFVTVKSIGERTEGRNVHGKATAGSEVVLRHALGRGANTQAVVCGGRGYCEKIFQS
jgi:hypothetical protein